MNSEKANIKVGPMNQVRTMSWGRWDLSSDLKKVNRRKGNDMSKDVA